MNRRAFLRGIATLTGALVVPSFEWIQPGPSVVVPRPSLIELEGISLVGIAGTSTPVNWTLLRGDEELLTLPLNAYGGITIWLPPRGGRIVGSWYGLRPMQSPLLLATYGFRDLETGRRYVARDNGNGRTITPLERHA